MEKNKLPEFSGNDLDKLLNQAFLELDFDQAQHRQMLDSIGHQALHKTPFSSLTVKKIFFNKIFLSVSLLLIASALTVWVKQPGPGGTIATVSAPVRQILQPAVKKANRKPIGTMTPLKRKQTTQHKEQVVALATPVAGHTTVAAAEAQAAVMFSGYIKSAKNGSGLAGALVYKLHSAVNVSSSEQGHFALSLPKGEHIIGISMTGYQTLTVSINITEDVTRDLVLNEVWKQLDEVTVRAENFIFPNLTDREKKANEKEKKAMAKMAAKLRQDKSVQKYAHISVPADQSLPAFYMSSGEITNLEYRTFLFDLIIQGKKEEFLLAKPEQGQWVNAAGLSTFDTLSKVYFSTRRFNLFPVVNISVTGAEMYCAWLSKLANDIRAKEGKPPIEIRLPFENEWLHAATAGRSNAVYPWPVDSIQNRSNWFLANCCIQKLPDKFKYPLGHPGKSDGKAYTSAGLATGNNNMATIDTWSYNPNDFDLYDVCGNASEMVYINESKAVKTKGGNWNSDFEHLKLNSEDEFNGNVKPSPMIGFRVCVTVKK